MARYYAILSDRAKERARALRKNTTKEERKLWYEFLRGFPLRVQRQWPVGPYIVDFCCCQAKCMIELDGGQHYETEQREYDEKRTDYLSKMGYRVLRYSNLDVLQNFPGVCQDIQLHLIKAPL